MPVTYKSKVNFPLLVGSCRLEEKERRLIKIMQISYFPSGLFLDSTESPFLPCPYSLPWAISPLPFKKKKTRAKNLNFPWLICFFNQRTVQDPSFTLKTNKALKLPHASSGCTDSGLIVGTSGLVLPAYKGNSLNAPSARAGSASAASTGICNFAF